MERMLLKMASQLNAYDEASLLALWDKYATTVERFEPTRRWEEAAIVFSLIQAVRLKNQLFNQRVAAGAEKGEAPLMGMDKVQAWLDRETSKSGASPAAKPEGGSVPGVGDGKAKKRCKVLRFSRRKSD